MDYEGQKLSELLFHIIILAFGGVGWIFGYFAQDFSYVFYAWAAGTAISVVVSCFCGDDREAPSRVGSSMMLRSTCMFVLDALCFLLEGSIEAAVCDLDIWYISCISSHPFLFLLLRQTLLSFVVGVPLLSLIDSVPRDAAVVRYIRR